MRVASLNKTNRGFSQFIKLVVPFPNAARWPPQTPETNAQSLENVPSGVSGQSERRGHRDSLTAHQSIVLKTKKKEEKKNKRRCIIHGGDVITIAKHGEISLVCAPPAGV